MIGRNYSETSAWLTPEKATHGREHIFTGLFELQLIQPSAPFALELHAEDDKKKRALPPVEEESVIGRASKRQKALMDMNCEALGATGRELEQYLVGPRCFGVLPPLWLRKFRNFG